MSLSYADLEKAARELISRGASDKDLVLRLHQLGASILDSIKIYRNIRGVSLGVAKEAVSAHEVWKSTVEESQALHEEAIAAARQAAAEVDLPTRSGKDR